MADIKKIKIGNTEYNVKDAVSGYITGITSSDVTTALGYIPYNSSNPNGYTSNIGTVTSVNNVQPVNGNVTLSIPAAQVQADWDVTDTTSKAFIKNKPYIPSGVVVDQTYDPTSINAQSGVAINGAGFLTGINSTMVTNALGYTPYSSANPNNYTSVVESTVSGWGFTKNAGTVTSVNNVSPVDGNVTLSIPAVDQTYNSSSANAQSGVAIEGAGFIKNVALGTNCIGILGATSSASIRSISIGKNSHAEGTGAISICSPTALNLHLGAYADGAIQIGVGKNTNANTLQVGSYQLLDENGIIPDVRISKQTTLSSSSTDIQIPSAKCVYDNLLLKADTTLSNVSSIDSNSAVQTALDGKANTSLSNLDSTGQAVIDGQWVGVNHTILANPTTAPTSDLPEIDLSSYLPNDNYAYEVLLMGAVGTGTTSGNQTRIILQSSIITDSYYMVSAQTRSTSSVTAYGCCVLPIGSDKELKVMGYASNTGAISLYLRGYRRIGTNS